MLDLAKLHEQILVSELLPRCPPRERAALIKQAGRFFAAAVTPPGKTPRSAPEGTSHLQETVEMWSERTVELAACNMELRQKITQHEAIEEALKKKERHYSQVLSGASGKFTQ